MVQLISTQSDDELQQALEATAQHLLAGAAVVFPTDTVYGLAALPAIPGAVETMVAMKGRDLEQPTAVLVANAAQAGQLVTGLDPRAVELMEEFWPGPLTLVLPNAGPLGAELGGDGTTVGVRSPEHGFILALAAKTGPIAATSANIHGQPPVTSAAEAAQTFPNVALVVDGGVGGTAGSTVVSLVLDQPTVLRPGAISEDRIVACWNRA